MMTVTATHWERMVMGADFSDSRSQKPTPSPASSGRREPQLCALAPGIPVLVSPKPAHLWRGGPALAGADLGLPRLGGAGAWEQGGYFFSLK